MKKNILSWVLLAILLVGCSQESVIEGTENGEQTLTFEAINGTNSQSRTTIDAGGLVVWNVLDKICVNGKESNNTTLTDGGSIAQFTVSGVTGTNFNAFYPAVMVQSYNSSNGKYELTLPNTQVYKNDVTFSDNANPSVAHAKSADGVGGYKLAFYNLCGIMKVNIKSADSTIGGIRYVRLTMHEDISGSFTADCQSHALTAGTGVKNKIIDMDLGTDKSTADNMSVYFVLPPNTYTAGWKMSLLNASKQVISTNAATTAMTIKRSKRSAMSLAFTQQPAMLIFKDFGLKTWEESQGISPKFDFVSRAIAHGVYWDNNGPKWNREQTGGNPFQQGIWIKVANLYSGTTGATTVKNGEATDVIRNDPNYVFLPAAGYEDNVTWNHISRDGVYNLGDRVFNDGGYLRYLHFNSSNTSIVDDRLYTIRRCFNWTINGPILE